METDFEKRARAKAEYMLALKQQKQVRESAQPATNAPSAQPWDRPSKNEAMTERERRLEERKKAFMAKKSMI